MGGVAPSAIAPLASPWRGETFIALQVLFVFFRSSVGAQLLLSASAKASSQGFAPIGANIFQGRFVAINLSLRWSESFRQLH
jgi:hypothetical protein